MIEPGMADVEVVRAGDDVHAGPPTDGNVAVTTVACQVHKRLVADRSVAEARRVREERLVADRGVAGAASVATRCLVTDRRVVVLGAKNKRALSNGGVEVASLI